MVKIDAFGTRRHGDLTERSVHHSERTNVEIFVLNAIEYLTELLDTQAALEQDISYRHNMFARHRVQTFGRRH